MRYGELTAFEERPHSPYYGCADATPLYVVLLDEYERWTGDRSSSATSSMEARAALHWIDEYADLQGNGYVSYKRRNEETGLENQCWKDSWDSISYRDGRLPGFPRATCELQGYAYDAKVRGSSAGARDLEGPLTRERAGEGGGGSQAPLQPRLLDRRREGTSPSRSTSTARRSTRSPRTTAICSGAGSWTSRRPKSVVEHLMGERLFSGWGVRTMADGRDALQPDRLPHRDDLAVRQLVHRMGPAPLRVQRGGGANSSRHPRRGRVLRRASARGVRRLSPLGDEVPSAVPHRMQPAGVVDRRAAAASCGRCSDWSRSATISSSIRRFPPASASWRCSISRGGWGRIDAFGRGRVAMRDEQGLRPQLG